MFDLWRGALDGLVVRHPDERRTVQLSLDDGPLRLMFHVWDTPDTRDPSIVVGDFTISTVKLACWPGLELARMWIAAAWAAYLLHEALELVTLADLRTCPLDPHEPPYTYCWLRTGFPATLTLETLERALCVVMAPETARALVSAHRDTVAP